MTEENQSRRKGPTKAKPRNWNRDKHKRRKEQKNDDVNRLGDDQEKGTTPSRRCERTSPTRLPLAEAVRTISQRRSKEMEGSKEMKETKAWGDTIGWMLVAVFILLMTVLCVIMALADAPA